MAAYVVGEQEAFYRGRELAVPGPLASGHRRLAAAGSPVIRSWLGSRQVYMRGERIILA